METGKKTGLIKSLIGMLMIGFILAQYARADVAEAEAVMEMEAVASQLMASGTVSSSVFASYPGFPTSSSNEAVAAFVKTQMTADGKLKPGFVADLRKAEASLNLDPSALHGGGTVGVNRIKNAKPTAQDLENALKNYNSTVKTERISLELAQKSVAILGDQVDANFAKALHHLAISPSESRDLAIGPGLDEMCVPDWTIPSAVERAEVPAVAFYRAANKVTMEKAGIAFYRLNKKDNPQLWNEAVQVGLAAEGVAFNTEATTDPAVRKSVCKGVNAKASGGQCDVLRGKVTEICDNEFGDQLRAEAQEQAMKDNSSNN